MYDISREQQNHRDNQWLLKNYDKLKTIEQETKEPTMNRVKMKCSSVVSQAKALYDAGKTHKEIGLLLGMSISSAGRILRMNNHDHHVKRKY